MTALEVTRVDLVAHDPTHEQASARLKMATAGFLSQFKPTTRTSYNDGLTQWYRWCRQVGLDPLNIDRPHIDLWGRHLEEERQLMPATVMHRLCTLRSFYRYCEDEGYVDRSPAAKIRLPKVSAESSTHGMTRQEAMQFLAASNRNPVQHALVALLLLNGLRISEALNANIEDMDVEAGHRVLRVTRKGGKRQLIPLSAKTARAVEAVIGERETGPILLTKDGKRFTRFAARDALVRIGRRANLTYRVHPHLLRHCFCTMALEAGSPLHDVQDSMGHADPRTTQRYNRRRGQLDRNATHLVSAFLG